MNVYYYCIYRFHQTHHMRNDRAGLKSGQPRFGRPAVPALLIWLYGLGQFNLASLGKEFSALNEGLDQMMLGHFQI